MVFDEKVTKSSAETSIYYEIDGKDFKRKRRIYTSKNTGYPAQEKEVELTFN